MPVKTLKDSALALPDVNFTFCDFANQHHCNYLIRLINEYKTDPMGGADLLTTDQEAMLLDGLAAHPSCAVLFILSKKEIVGLATYFINFSTFQAKPYINVHDLIIQKENRGKGLGRKLLKEIIRIGEQRGYCKVTLEVREDNAPAQALYKSLGFSPYKPEMLFWTRSI